LNALRVLHYRSLSVGLPSPGSAEFPLGLRFDRQVLGEMFSYGAKIQVSQFGALVGFQSPKFIILRFLGPVAVSLYDLSHG
jgi:O-antigen/teichoic acid export membrane protein